MLLLLLLFVYPNIAYAYLDPGSGSYVLQVLLAIVIGGLYSIKVYWRKKIKAIFMRSASHEKMSRPNRLRIRD